ncbi:tetratricopeptide repeat protein 1-like [Oratosquilla oratoria]|uniref:tetratricopeptide repeat protein 1-like n=1 Tax=Oratosquilla oratoria TaxID=337810 RepID=UPI003F757F42
MEVKESVPSYVDDLAQKVNYELKLEQDDDDDSDASSVTSFHSAGEDMTAHMDKEEVRETTVVKEDRILPDGNDGETTDVKEEDHFFTDDNDDECISECDNVSDEECLKDMELQLTEEEKKVKLEEAKSHKEEGNKHFKEGNFEEALTEYTSGLRICPLAFPRDRAILYSNRAATKTHLDKKKSAIEDCTKAIDLHGVYVKAIVRRATLQEETDKLDEALKDFQRVLELEPKNAIAADAVLRLPRKIEERNEKLKAEMMGTLKELGNKLLSPFGLSTENFKLNQDPQSGSYNISFSQDPNK